MSAGPHGFRGAPVTRALLFFTLATSIGAHYMRDSSEASPQNFLLDFFVLKNPSTWVLTTMLLYSTRLFERLWGSVKFGSFLFMTSLISILFQIGFLSASTSLGYSIFTKTPTCVVVSFLYAMLVQYYYDVPVVSSANVFGLTISNKTQLYLFSALQVAYWPETALNGCIAGIFIGLMYRSSNFGLKTFRIPHGFCQLLASIFGPIFGDERRTVQPLPQEAVQAPVRPAGGHRANFPAAAVDEGAVDQLVAMGFPRAEAMEALQICNNDIARATNLLLDGRRD